jgi:hypothetical protein
MSSAVVVDTNIARLTLPRQATRPLVFRKDFMRRANNA